MAHAKLTFLAILLLFFSVISPAQKKLSDVETQDFFRLIKQTNKYKALKHKVDSFNNAIGEEVLFEKVKLEIITQKADESDDVYLFDAEASR